MMRDLVCDRLFGQFSPSALYYIGSPLPDLSFLDFRGSNRTWQGFIQVRAGDEAVGFPSFVSPMDYSHCWHCNSYPQPSGTPC